jgi:hypothetical protein
MSLRALDVLESERIAKRRAPDTPQRRPGCESVHEQSTRLLVRRVEANCCCGFLQGERRPVEGALDSATAGRFALQELKG